MCGAAGRPTIVYSDASWPEWSQEPRLGWIVCRPDKEPLGYTMELPEQFVRLLLPRKTQIFAAEAIVPLMVLLLSPELLARSDVVWFIDDEAAVSSLIMGTSRAEDVGHLAAAVRILCLKLEVRLLFEWIDSKSNPADGLSRDGLRDELSCRQGWQTAEINHARMAIVSDFLAQEEVARLIGPLSVKQLI